MRRTAIDRSPKLKVGARVQVIVGFRTGSHDGVVGSRDRSVGQGAVWIVDFPDGVKGAYPSEFLRVLPKPFTSPKPVNPVNRKRKDTQFEKAFGKQGRDGKWILSQPCSVPECNRGPVQAHHAKTQGSGGDRRHLVPLCVFHHAAFHSAGRKSFDSYYKVDLLAIAADLAQARELEWADPE